MGFIQIEFFMIVIKHVFYTCKIVIDFKIVIFKIDQEY